MIVWSRAYKNNIILIQSIQSRILKIINKNCSLENSLLNLNQVFTLEALLFIQPMFHYEGLKDMYNKSTHKTIRVVS